LKVYESIAAHKQNKNRDWELAHKSRFLFLLPILFRVLHDIFILHKVIDQRYHGEDQCDPHNDIG